MRWGCINPALLGHHAGKGLHFRVKPGEGIGHQGQCLLEAEQGRGRGGRRGIEIPGGKIGDLLGAGHGAQGSPSQRFVGVSLGHQGIQGGALDMALMAGDIQRIEPTRLATLGGEFVAPAVDGVEDGGYRLLL
ncbi:hypothetical protein LGKMAHEF_01689 [Aeromonas salmonicida]